jgi:hypothetical protein
MARRGAYHSCYTCRLPLSRWLGGGHIIICIYIYILAVDAEEQAEISTHPLSTLGGSYSVASHDRYGSLEDCCNDENVGPGPVAWSVRQRSSGPQARTLVLSY